jgi:hypothetical protein
MLTPFGLALAGALALGPAAIAKGQGMYAGSATYGYRYPGPVSSGGYARGYAFKDEPVMSINRSYLGYSNFVYYGPHPPAPGFLTDGLASRAPGYVRPSAPSRRGFPLFGGRRRGYRW